MSREATPNTPTSPKEKKHDLAWVIINILARGGLVAFFVYLPFTFVLPSFTSEEGVMIWQLVSLCATLISYLGIWWGCRYVVKETYIDEKDFFKIGYWVGFIPIAFAVLSPSTVKFQAAPILLGIFLTPRLVKKWLIKYSGLQKTEEKAN